jgi:5-methylcytosine-specific restriction endonuclease McrBC GTP-binding regulatory subunit McrB
LAYLLAGAKAPEQIRRVQFHQSYAYEDFIQGFRPQEGAGFVRQDGPFLRFCAEALQDPNTPYVLLIDEINRGNVSKILGELMLLIEADKRSPEWALELAYSRPGEAAFHVPPNLHIIGTMNTADRSLAMVDYALRRRFSFIDVEPAFGSAGFQRALREQLVDEDLIQSISARMRALNERIRNDPDLRAGFQIGHSYFCEPSDGAPRDEEWFSRVVRFEIEPLLREYWFDDTGKADEAVAILIDDE